MSTDTLERPEAPRAPASTRPSTVAPATPERYRQVLTAIVAIGPVVVALWVLVRSIGAPVPWFELALMLVFLFVIGHGITVGFHRLFTHKSFEATPPAEDHARGPRARCRSRAR